MSEAGDRVIVEATGGVPPVGPYSHAVVANGFVFVSGQGPIDPATGRAPAEFAEQVRQTMRNLATVLDAAGSTLDDIVKMNCYLTDLTRFKEFNEIYRQSMPPGFPARTTVATGLLGILVEIDCIAIQSR